MRRTTLLAVLRTTRCLSTTTRAGGFDLLGNFRNTIDGKLTTTKETRQGINPATGKPNPQVPISTLQDVNQAVKAAQKAFPGWASTTFEERQRRLLAFADAIAEHEQSFAKLLVMEQGKPVMLPLLPLRDSQELTLVIKYIRAALEVRSAVDWLRAFCKFDLKDEVMEEDDETKIVCRHTPIGVSVGIVPWNYPLSLACAKLGPATLAGNPIIIKPSPFTPYCGLKLGDL